MIQSMENAVRSLRGNNPFRFHGGYYRFVMNHATAFAPSDKPEDVSWGAQKECYKNASELCFLSGGRYIYCEGIAVANISITLPIDHAWLFDRETGCIIDHTWRGGGLAYLGFPVLQDSLQEYLITEGYYGGIIRHALAHKGEGFAKQIIYNCNLLTKQLVTSNE